VQCCIRISSDASTSRWKRGLSTDLRDGSATTNRKASASRSEKCVTTNSSQSSRGAAKAGSSAPGSGHCSMMQIGPAWRSVACKTKRSLRAPIVGSLVRHARDVRGVRVPRRGLAEKNRAATEIAMTIQRFRDSANAGEADLKRMRERAADRRTHALEKSRTARRGARASPIAVANSAALARKLARRRPEPH
jgi:hypothetical protein